MFSYSVENLSATLEHLDDALQGNKLRKAVDDLVDDVDQLREHVQEHGQQSDEHNWMVRRRIADLESTVDDLERDGIDQDALKRVLRKLWRKVTDDDMRKPPP